MMWGIVKVFTQVIQSIHRSTGTYASKFTVQSIHSGPQSQPQKILHSLFKTYIRHIHHNHARVLLSNRGRKEYDDTSTITVHSLSRSIVVQEGTYGTYNTVTLELIVDSMCTFCTHISNIYIIGVLHDVFISPVTTA